MATEDLPEWLVEVIAASEMDGRFDHLDEHLNDDVTGSSDMTTTLPDLFRRATEADTVAEQLRALACVEGHLDEIRRWTAAEAERLGLPKAFADHWPASGELPVEYPMGGDYGADASLTWKALEWRMRTGRIVECDPTLIAEALEGEAADDGPAWLRRTTKDLMFYLAWPSPRTYSLHVEIDTAADFLVDAILSSPSCVLGLDLQAA